MTDVSSYLSLPYTRVLKRDEDGDIVATIAELDGCMAHGADESEALQKLRDAQVAWLEAAIATGQDVPVPEMDEDLPSGKFVVRLPRSLHQRLNKLAKKDDVSLNQVMVMAATEHVARRESRKEQSTHAPDVSAWHRPPARWSFARESCATSKYLRQLKRHGVVAAEAGENDPHFTRRVRKG
ncbi:MAG: type II toxin-antitoxin system HicB family antitoxin [Acidimicrobiia bacterium]|nr:type II toxin-antitoxin system HicB family antitoxin [Acidimicrobiia bacterium]